MRERVYDGMGGPFDDVPDAPDNCVICRAPLLENARGEVTGCENDGCTCSDPCHVTWLKREMERDAEERASDAALARHCEDMEREWQIEWEFQRS